MNFMENIKKTVEVRCKALTRVILANEDIDALKIIIERKDNGSIDILLSSFGIRDDKENPFYKHKFTFKLKKQNKNVSEKSRLNLLRGKKKQQALDSNPVDKPVENVEKTNEVIKNTGTNSSIINNEQTIVQKEIKIAPIIPNENSKVINNTVDIKVNNMKILNLNKLNKLNNKTYKPIKTQKKNKTIKKPKKECINCLELEKKYTDLKKVVNNCYTCSRGIANIDEFFAHIKKLYKDKIETENKIIDQNKNKKYKRIIDPDNKEKRNHIDQYVNKYLALMTLQYSFVTDNEDSDSEIE